MKMPTREKMNEALERLREAAGDNPHFKKWVAFVEQEEQDIIYLHKLGFLYGLLVEAQAINQWREHKWLVEEFWGEDYKK